MPLANTVFHWNFSGQGELEGRYADVILGRAPRDMEPISGMMTRASSWWHEAVIPWIGTQGYAEPEDGQETIAGRGDFPVASHGGLISCCRHSGSPCGHLQQP